MAAPCTALSPTPPQPITTTSLPTSIRAVLVTAPKPVITPHPSRAALVTGIDVGNRDHLRRVDERLLGERARLEPVDEGVAVGVGQRTGRVDGEAAGARHRHALRAARARAAAADQRDDHPITDGDLVDAVADRRDGPGRLVAVDGRQATAPRPVDEMDVGVADRAGLDPHLHLAGSGRGDGDLLDGERGSELTTDRSFDSVWFAHWRNVHDTVRPGPGSGRDLVPWRLRDPGSQHP